MGITKEGTTVERHVGDVLGVRGVFNWSHRRSDGTWSVRTWGSEWRRLESDGDQNLVIQTTIRFDDSCGNGHDTFSVTADIRIKDVHGYRGEYGGGCCHDDIQHAFPELAHLIKWHLCSTDGPMHYTANTVYLAGDKDHRGLRKGETKPLANGRTGLPVWKLVLRDWQGSEVSSSYFGKLVDCEVKPYGPCTADYEPVLIVGEGKERQLDAARRTAVWPDATDEQLCSDRLGALLDARLPAVLRQFREETEAAGFQWSD